MCYKMYENSKKQITYPKLLCPLLAELRSESTCPDSKKLFPPASLDFFVVLPVIFSKIHHFNCNSVLIIVTYIYEVELSTYIMQKSDQGLGFFFIVRPFF